MLGQTVHVDLYGDWIAHLRGELVSAGYDVTKFKTREKIAWANLNLRKRAIRPIRRQVVKAKGFTCPDHVCTALAEIERKIREGERLFPHLSREMVHPLSSDDLLNAWGIHHLHLSTKIGPDGRSGGTDDLLFARFDSTTAYLIAILPHKGSWTEQAMVKTLHDNWPDAIKRFRLPPEAASTQALTNQEYANLRKNGYNTGVVVDPGIEYALGLGSMASRHLGTEVAVGLIRHRRLLDAYQQRLIDNIEAIIEAAKVKGMDVPRDAAFRLVEDDLQAYAHEESSGAYVPVGDRGEIFLEPLSALL